MIHSLGDLTVSTVMILMVTILFTVTLFGYNFVIRDKWGQKINLCEKASEIRLKIRSVEKGFGQENTENKKFKTVSVTHLFDVLHTKDIANVVINEAESTSYDDFDLCHYSANASMSFLTLKKLIKKLDFVRLGFLEITVDEKKPRLLQVKMQLLGLCDEK